MSPSRDSPKVLVIGGGGTGAAVAWDLSQRGFKTVLVERGELTSGTTGRHHGQLHSGARYVVTDPATARICFEESLVLCRIAGDTIEMNNGLFVAIDDEGMEYLPKFLEGCKTIGIPAKLVGSDVVRKMEPALSDKIIEAVVVPDGTIDAWRLPLRFFAAARRAGAEIKRFTEVKHLDIHNGVVTGALVIDLVRGEDSRIDADLVVNAAGAWAGKIAAMAGVRMDITFSPGALVAARGRLVNMVISKLYPPGDGDIIVPQRQLSIIGTTQSIIDNPDECAATEVEVEELISAAAQLVPSFASAPIHAAWSAPRPLASGVRKEDYESIRGLSRGFRCIDHTEIDGIEGFVSVVGGKATVLRAMGERTVDMVCRKLGLESTCRTKEIVLPDHRSFFRETVPISKEGV